MRILVAVLLLVLWLDSSSGQGNLTATTTGVTVRILGGSNGFVGECTYMYMMSSITWRWLRDGVVVAGENMGILNIFPVKLVDQGNYSCQVLDNMERVIETARAGSLVVFDPNIVFSAPPVQYVVNGGDLQLSCTSTLPDTVIKWTRSGSATTDSIVNATEADGGIYECVIQERSTAISLSPQPLPVLVTIILPPNITNISPELLDFSNEEVNLTVHFVSSYGNTTMVTWQKNAELLPTDRFNVTYDVSGTRGVSTLTLDPARRTDSGEYLVCVYNSHTLIPADRRSATTEFTVLVQVPPTMPDSPSFQRINDTATRVNWTIPNSTLPDAAPDRLMLTITNSAQSPLHLEAAVREVVVTTQPGVNYTAAITAINTDDSATSPPTSLYVEPTAPSVKTTSALRISPTAFNITLQVLYTGAGPRASLYLVDVEFRSAAEGGGAAWQQLISRVKLDSVSSGTWYTELEHTGFAMLDKVEFSFRTQNNVISLTSLQQVQGVSVAPGQPVIINGTTTSSSLTITAQLSSAGTHPLTSLHTIVSAPDHPTRNLTKTEGLQVGGAVEVEVQGLTPGTSYTVIMCVSNSAGKGQSSAQRIFSTMPGGMGFPVWLMAVVAIVGSCLIVTLTLVVLISCYCKRHGNEEQKINLSSISGGNGVRQRPVGATDSVDSLSTGHSYSYGYGSKNFILSPPPVGNSSLSPTPSPARQEYSGRNAYIYTNPKQRPHASSFSGSEASEHSKYFTYRQSPAHQSYIAEVDKLSHSMPMLEDPDTPTMPPNCSTFV